MRHKTIGSVIIEAVTGDIANQPDMDAVVNAANAMLRSGGGVAGALHRAAGPGLEEECRPLAPIAPGQAVITGAHRLPNRYVIHCLGPVYDRDQPADELLAACYRNALNLAEQNAVAAIAFPPFPPAPSVFPRNRPRASLCEPCWKRCRAFPPSATSVLCSTLRMTNNATRGCSTG